MITFGSFALIIDNSVVFRDHKFFEITDSASLTCIKLHSMDKLCDSVHRYNSLNVLFFQKPLLSNLKLFEAFNLSATAFEMTRDALLETTAKVLENRNKKIWTVSKLKILPFLDNLFKEFIRSLWILIFLFLSRLLMLIITIWFFHFSIQFFQHLGIFHELLKTWDYKWHKHNDDKGKTSKIGRKFVEISDLPNRNWHWLQRICITKIHLEVISTWVIINIRTLI